MGKRLTEEHRRNVGIAVSETYRTKLPRCAEEGCDIILAEHYWRNVGYCTKHARINPRQEEIDREIAATAARVLKLKQEMRDGGHSYDWCVRQLGKLSKEIP